MIPYRLGAFKIMPICELLFEWKKLKNPLPQIDPKELNADAGFFLEPVFFQPCDWSKNNYFKLRHYAAHIFQYFLLIIMIYFWIYFFLKKFEKLSSIWRKIEKIQFFEKIYFVYRPPHLFFILYSERARRDLLLEPKITPYLVGNGSYGHFYSEKMMKNWKKSSFSKKSILFMDHRTFFIPYTERSRRDLHFEPKLTPIAGGS